MTDKMKDEEPSIAHLKWLIESRGQNNKTALKLLDLFEEYPKQLRQHELSDQAQELVGVTFSLWRAAFLADRKGWPERKVSHAEKFLRKILVDNQIGFPQDRLWREWTFNYYMDDALLRLEQFQEGHGDLEFRELYPKKGKRTSKNRWDMLHKAFAIAVDRLEGHLKDSKAMAAKSK
jgi:hypothetical protein